MLKDPAPVRAFEEHTCFVRPQRDPPIMSKLKSDPVHLHEGKHLRFVRRGHWEYAERRGISGAVVIVAVTREGRLLLTEQFRPPVNRVVIELPAGLAGDIPGEEAEAFATAARRELLEETGYAAARMKRLAGGPASAGVSNEIVTFFLATGLREVGAGGGDAHEDIIVHKVPLTRVTRWLRQKEKDGALIDVKIFAGLYFLIGGNPV
jgi:ADP-ribose pyrophosphatase